MDQSPQAFDQFTLPGDIPDPVVDPADQLRFRQAQDEREGRGVPSEDWRARGLASPAGRGWEPVSSEGSRQRAVPFRHPADGPAVPSERLRLPRAGEDLSPYLADLPETSDTTWPAIQFDRARQRVFLLELSECGQVRPSAARAGISYRTAYRERRGNPAFARAWEAALLSARAYGEDVLAARAIDGVEEVIFFRGEEVGRRVRYDARLLLAHLARLDRRAEDAATRAYAADLEGALDRYLAGCDDPAPVCDDCGEALPVVESAPEAEGEGEAEAAPATFSPGPCDRCDMPSAKAAAARAEKRAEEAAFEPCPDCGGRCLMDDEDALTQADCQWFGNRLERMEEARPAGTRPPHDYAGYGLGEVDGWQMAAFEAGVERWWLVLPPAEGEDPREWHFADDYG